MSNIELILNKVEDLRENLNKLAKDKNKKFSDPEIVSISKELDVLLNRYHKLMTAKMENLKTK